MAITILPPELVSKIAAGEVVERPASVVKELVENALDAGALRVRVEVRQGGRDLIRVTDDGVGMVPTDVRLAVEPHATSKVAALADLQNITTLGFRGEALASIAAVSRFSILSRPAGGDEGYEVAIDGGRLVTERMRGCPEGTAVTVRDLFQHVPARLKFLRSVATESSFIARIVHAYALGRPDVRFELTVDGRSALRTAGGGDLKAAIGQVFGHDLAGAMIALPSAVPDAEAVMSLGGFVSHPTIDRADRSAILFFVNGRWVQHRGMLYALEEAYHSMLMVGRHPAAVVSLSMPPHLVDVNVHPSKQEVRFVHDRDVTRMVGAAARAALLGNVREMAVPIIGLPSSYAGAAGGRGFGSSAPRAWPGAVDASGSVPSPRPYDGAAMRASGIDSGAGGGVEAAIAAMPLPDSARLRVVGQVVGTYIIAEDAAGMYLIDQHAAHERVMLERMRERLARGESDTQWLLVPVTCNFPPAVQETMEQSVNTLAALGYAVEPFGDGAWLLRGVPAALRGFHDRDPVAVLEAALAELGRGGDGLAERERIAALLACHNAIRAGQVLTDPEMRALIRQLEQVAVPGHCAHGRPTMIHISQAELEREFSRR